MKKLIAALLVSLSTVATAGPFDNTQGKFDISGVQNEIHIGKDYGGNVLEYIEKYSEWREGDMKVRVDGLCISACTLMLGLLPKKNVCADDTAHFGFHSARYATGEFAWEATRLIWNTYPEKVKKMLIDKGWNGEENTAHNELVWLKGTDILPMCQ